MSIKASKSCVLPPSKYVYGFREVRVGFDEIGSLFQGIARISSASSGGEEHEGSRNPRIFPWWGRSVNSWDMWKFFYYIVTTTSTVWTTSFKDTTTVTLKCTPHPSSTLYINYGPYGHLGHYGEQFAYHDQFGRYGKYWTTTWSSSVFGSC